MIPLSADWWTVAEFRVVQYVHNHKQLEAHAQLSRAENVRLIAPRGQQKTFDIGIRSALIPRRRAVEFRVAGQPS